jgi:hypothetical protein
VVGRRWADGGMSLEVRQGRGTHAHMHAPGVNPWSMPVIGFPEEGLPDPSAFPEICACDSAVCSRTLSLMTRLLLTLPCAFLRAPATEREGADAVVCVSSGGDPRPGVTCPESWMVALPRQRCPCR